MSIPSANIKNRPTQVKPVLPLLVNRHRLIILTLQHLQKADTTARVRQAVESSAEAVRISLVHLPEASREERHLALAFVASLKADCVYYDRQRQPVGNDLFDAMLAIVPGPYDPHAHEQVKVAVIETVVQLYPDTLADKVDRMAARLRELGVEDITPAKLIKQARAICKRDGLDIREVRSQRVKTGTDRFRSTLPVRVDLDGDVLWVRLRRGIPFFRRGPGLGSTRCSAETFECVREELEAAPSSAPDLPDW
ncbi:MAG: hypothetical protein NTY19_07170 [Planctomycetota bacterium]|nr:hypothetical protein [Planctomycetota bacterium]